MKIFKITVAVLIIATFSGLAFGLTHVVFANSFQSAKSITVAAEETIKGDLFASGEVIVVEGTVQGDVFAAGQSIVVKGVINGDLYAATDSLEVTGVIRDDILFAARSANLIGGKIGGSIIMLADTVILDSETTVGGSLLFALNSLLTNAKINGGITGSAESITINNAVGQNIRVFTDSLTFSNQAVINGDVLYSSAKEASIDSGANINGNIERQVHNPSSSAEGFLRFMRAFIIWSYLSVLLSGFVLVLLFKKPLQKASEQLLKNPMASLGWGAVGVLLLLPVFTLLAITVVGIPLAFLFAMAAGVALYVGKIVVGLVLGNLVIKKFKAKPEPNLYAAFAVGISIYHLLKLVPVLNVFAILAVTFFGFGTIILTLKQALLTAKPKK